MKQIQVILTIDMTNDEYSGLMNHQIDISTFVHHSLENGDDNLSFDFPALIISRLANEPNSTN